MTTPPELVEEEIIETDFVVGTYDWAWNQCRLFCQLWGGIQDIQIRTIVNDVAELSERTRSLYYWQLRLDFPNPYE
jgi:hypothetical protein